MMTAMVPSRTAVAHPSELLQLPTLGASRRNSSRRDESNKSHSIKEIFVEQTTDKERKRSSPTAPTPRARGDGIHHFESEEDEDENDFGIGNPSEKRSMVDPPGFNESTGGVSRSKQGSREPETAASIHRRRKRSIEQRARKIIGGSRDAPGKRRDRDPSSSQHSSWVPTRRIDRDPENIPYYNYEMNAQISRQTMEIRDRAIPQKSWRPSRQLSDSHNNLADDDEMDFSTTNEWVPSEFYRTRKAPLAMQIFPSGTPHIVSPYPPKEKPQYQEYLQHQQLQRQQLQLQHGLEVQQQQQYQLIQKGENSWRPLQIPHLPPSIIHTITTATTPSTPTPDNEPSLENTITTASTPATTIPEIDPLKRKSQAPEMALSDAVISSNESEVESFKALRAKRRNRNRDSEASSESFKKKFPSQRISAHDSKAPTKDSEESSTIQGSLVSLRKSKKRWSDDSKNQREAEENSTILDSIKRRKEKWASDESLNLQPGSLQKIIDREYTFDTTDDGFDESLLSSSLTHLDAGIPNNITIPSDITFDLDATKKSTLTMSDDVTWNSTINNSIVSQEDTAIAAASAAAKESNLSSKGSKTTPDTGGAQDSLIGSGTSGFTGGSLVVNGLTESGMSGLTPSGIMNKKDAFGNTIEDKLSTLADEIGARARRKMEDIPSEVSSYVCDTLSQNRQDSEGDSRSSWHHRSVITPTSTMVSTKKVANKKSKFKPRRSSTSTLPSIGTAIPEESWDYGNMVDDEDEDDDDSIYEIDDLDSDESSRSDSNDYIEELEMEDKLSSIMEVASRDMSMTNSRDMSRTNSRDMSRTNSRYTSGESSRDMESGESYYDDNSDSDDNSNNDKEEDDDEKPSSNRSHTTWQYCACLDIRCFERRDDGSRGRCNPTMGVYVVTFLVLMLISVWGGIGIVWYRVRQSE